MFHTGAISKILKEKCGEALQRECNNKREYTLQKCSVFDKYLLFLYILDIEC